MIVLNSTPALKVTAKLTLISDGEAPSIALGVNETKEKIGDKWIPSTTKREQEVVGIGLDGAFTLKGEVPEDLAVQISAAHTVVVEVLLTQGLKGAYDKGRVSQAYVDLKLIQVLEVYSAPGRKVYPLTNGTK
ncbi:MAG: hypothetical protein JW942_07825 [Opitutales bacterium]|nr:hypothetical protein [Opitutales bacterium]